MSAKNFDLSGKELRKRGDKLKKYVMLRIEGQE
jgi:hypothetical protein